MLSWVSLGLGFLHQKIGLLVLDQTDYYKADYGLALIEVQLL